MMIPSHDVFPILQPRSGMVECVCVVNLRGLMLDVPKHYVHASFKGNSERKK